MLGWRLAAARRLLRSKPPQVCCEWCVVCGMHVRLLVFDWEVLGACAARVGVVVACLVGNGRVACCVGGWEIAGNEG